MALFVGPFAPLSARRTLTHSARIAVRPVRLRQRQRSTMIMLPPPDATVVGAFDLATADPWIAAWGGMIALFMTTLRVLGVRSPGEVEQEAAAECAGALHVLRVQTVRPLCVALADGSRAVRAGESMLSFPDAPAAHAAASELEAAANAAGCVDELRVSLASANPNFVSAECPLVPRSQAQWRQRTAREAEEEDWMANVHWEDTERTRWECDRLPAAGEDDSIEREWAEVLKSLTPLVARREEDVCKLCGGCGTRRCSRCGGASAQPGCTFKCKCNMGSVPCDWCGGDGYAQ